MALRVSFIECISFHKESLVACVVSAGEITEVLVWGLVVPFVRFLLPGFLVGAEGAGGAFRPPGGANTLFGPTGVLVFCTASTFNLTTIVDPTCPPYL